MIHAHIRRGRPVPTWAVFGAPLVGVPLMVALLAVVAPERHAVGAEPETESTVEGVELDTADWSFDVGDPSSERSSVQC